MSKPIDQDTRMQAAIAYLITGSSEEAGKMCNVTGRTIRYWMQEPWWEALLDEAKGVKQKELDALWTGLIHKATDKLRERISDGDPVVTRTGEIRYVPVKAKDLAVVTAIAVDKRAILRGQVTSRREVVSVDEKLQKIADKYEKLNSSNKAEELDTRKLQ